MGDCPSHRLSAIAPAAAILVVDGDDVPTSKQVKHARDIVSSAIIERRARLYEDIPILLVGHGRVSVQLLRFCAGRSRVGASLDWGKKS